MGLDAIKILSPIQIGSSTIINPDSVKTPTIMAEKIAAKEIVVGQSSINEDTVSSVSAEFTDIQAQEITFDNYATLKYDDEYHWLHSNKDIYAPDYKYIYSLQVERGSNYIEDRRGTDGSWYYTASATVTIPQDVLDLTGLTYKNLIEQYGSCIMETAQGQHEAEFSIQYQHNANSAGLTLSCITQTYENPIKFIITININASLSSILKQHGQRLDDLGFSGAQDIQGTVTVGGEDKRLIIGKVAVLGKIVYGYIYSGGLIKNINNLDADVKDLRKISKMASVPGPIDNDSTYYQMPWFGNGDLRIINIVNTDGALDFTTSNLTYGELLPISVTTASAFVYSWEAEYNIYEN